MNIVVFASGGGNNLLTAIQTAQESVGKIRVSLVVTDRIGIPAIDIATAHNIPVIAKNFEAECGIWSECKNDPIRIANYQKAAERFHDAILDQILLYEKKCEETMDLLVLSYHRLIQGKLLRHFDSRIINQHPGDLTKMYDNEDRKRKYVGLSPVFDALSDGNTQTRTTNFLVREGCDDGELLCSGPWVEYEGTIPVTRASAKQHEIVQKKFSDRPCLRHVLIGIAEGLYAIHKSKRHLDGRHVVLFNKQELPYEGYNLSTNPSITFSL